ncbi:DODA-type extradiol aromatic ring-opening family dioxygenase [Aspergillus ibericus CBS 121593]|uniref:Aromatic ring-opening dioxygenase family protein n=1 Tax=Aspergillus ibericus CBS 121593 TaxID=1448316 RepID=A0A395GQZ1_9EURO|nr:aromatic ring-opening dioxygenase family protein [Aspergillus ibericus CBS 121593]RAK97980.1 aromatic ring-opening dioxygenase family protein [Aspergillus ibericus CBS 121593]
MGLPPVHFFSHGSPMMLCETTESSAYWRRCGDEALAHNVKGIVIMSAHWAALGDRIEVATNPAPRIRPVGFVPSHDYKHYPLTPDLSTAHRCLDLLSAEGFNVSANPHYNWIVDVYIIITRMFPDGNAPPTTVISMNARYDPHYHLKVGSTLRQLRQENYLLIGTGGAVHNLYRNRWKPMIKYLDSLAMETPPEEWALEFRQSLEDVMTKTSGPQLRRAVTRLMKHPQFRDAHATDDHFMAAVFVAGVVGDVDDEGCQGVMGAETWELTNMANSQFTFGEWPKLPVAGYPG